MALRHGTWVSQETPGIGVTSPLDARLAMAGTLVKDSTGKARSGVFYDGTSNIVSGTAGMSYQIARAVFVQARSVADGAIVFANDGTINVPTDPAPVANSRIDVVYVWHRDFVTDGQNSDPIAGVVQGAASPTPVAPNIPDGAVELARVTVTANATATNGLVIDQTSQFTAAAGGVVMFRTKTDLNAWTTAQHGQHAEVFAEPSTNGPYQRRGTSWDAVGVPLILGHMGRSGGSQPANGRVTMEFSALLRGGMTFSGGDSSLVVPRAGIYRVNAQVYGTGGVPGYTVFATVLRNGTAAASPTTRFWKGDAGDHINHMTGMVELAANDKISLSVTSPANTWGTTGWNGTWLEVQYVGPAA